MKDEIKEILDRLKDDTYVPLEDGRDYKLLDKGDDKLLLDYTTNLQEELKSANESITWWTNRFNALQEKNERLKEINKEQANHLISKDNLSYEDYKSRNEKAIDKIQYIIDYGFDYDGFNTVESLKGLIDMLVDYARQSKNILQGSDKEC